MKLKWLAAVFALLSVLGGQAAFAQILINEYNPNPLGTEEDTAVVELIGPAGTSLDGYSLITVEGDGTTGPGALNGDLADLTGFSFDANGFATITGVLANVENPVHTLVLAQNFTGTPDPPGNPPNNGTDLDTNDDGTLDLPFPGTVIHAIGVSNEVGRPLYGSQLGGVDMVYPTALDPTDNTGPFFDTYASNDPQIVFRDRVSGLYYQGGLDFTLLADANGTVVADGPGGVDDLMFDMTGLTPGAANPTVIPEPTAAGLTMIASMALLAVRRRPRD